MLAASTALATVLNAVFLYRSSLLFPDIPATATFTTGFLFLVLGARRAQEEKRGRAPLAFVVLAGMLFGWTYLIREFSVILVPAVAIQAVILRYGLMRLVLLCAAALTGPFLELAYGLVKYDDPLAHVHALFARRHRPVNLGDKPIVDQITGELKTPLDTLAVFPRDVVTFWSGWIVLALLVPYVVALVVTRDRRLLLFAPWLFGFWIIMALIGLGTLPSGRWILNITNIRYWYPALPALIMGGFAGITLLTTRFASAQAARTLVPVLAVSLSLVVFIPGVANFKTCESTGVWRNDPIQRWAELRNWLASPEAQRYDIIYTDPKTERLVPAFTHSTFGTSLWKGTLQKIGKREPIVPANVPSTALILIHKDRFRPYVRHPDTFHHLRREWMPVFETSDRHMVVLAPRPATSDKRLDPRGSWSIVIPPVPLDPICGQNPYVHFPESNRPARLTWPDFRGEEKIAIGKRYRATGGRAVGRL